MSFPRTIKDLIIIFLYGLGFLVWTLVMLLLVTDWRPLPGKYLNIPFWIWKLIILFVLFVVSHFYWKILVWIQRPEIETILKQHLERYKDWPFTSLKELIEKPDYVNVRTKSGEVFTLRFQAFLVAELEDQFKVIKVIASVEAGTKNSSDTSSSFFITSEDEILDDIPFD